MTPIRFWLILSTWGSSHLVLVAPSRIQIVSNSKDPAKQVVREFTAPNGLFQTQVICSRSFSAILWASGFQIYFVNCDPKLRSWQIIEVEDGNDLQTTAQVPNVCNAPYSQYDYVTLHPVWPSLRWTESGERAMAIYSEGYVKIMDFIYV